MALINLLVIGSNKSLNDNELGGFMFTSSKMKAVFVVLVVASLTYGILFLDLN